MAAVRSPWAGGRRRGAQRRLSLSLVILRYFAYIIAGLALTWLAAFTVLAGSINTGAVYPANYGAAHAAEFAEALAGAPAINAADIPTAYGYAVLDGTGAVTQTNLDGDELQAALDAARSLLDGSVQPAGQAEAAGSASTAEVSGAGGITYAVAPRADGGACVLSSAYLPQFSDPALAESLPNPQNLMLAAGCAMSAVVIALIARRASRVITRKMAPLVEAAGRIGRQELDFAVERSNVREIDDVLGAVEAMRASLKESLEARWRADQQQREQVAALAHDLKTPLTVLRANADFVSEEMASENLDAGMRRELSAAARDIAGGAERLDGYVRLLIEASRGQAAVNALEPVAVSAFAQAVEKDARALAHAAGRRIKVAQDPRLAGARIDADAEALDRAVMNLVSNALDHAAGTVALSFSPAATRPGKAERPLLVIAVEDDGPGFSPAALEHGCERFFRDDASRAGAAGGAHYGLGLATASDIARAHGGSVELANRANGRGAVATITVPLG